MRSVFKIRHRRGCNILKKVSTSCIQVRIHIGAEDWKIIVLKKGTNSSTVICMTNSIGQRAGKIVCLDDPQGKRPRGFLDFSFLQLKYCHHCQVYADIPKGQRVRHYLS